MKKLCVFLLAISLLLVFSIIPAEAKDLSKRIGLGYNAQTEISIGDFGIGMAAPSIKYAFTPKFGIQGVFGFNKLSNEQDYSQLVFGGKFLYNIIQEDNMNFYAGGGLVIINESNAESETGTVIVGCVGEEFFFSGLPNLGFAAELGLVIASMYDMTFIGTYGGFLSLGVHYYF